MKKYYLLTIGLCLLLLNVKAVEKTLVDENNYKYKVAKEIFDNLVEAKGDKRMRTPKFVMSKGKRYVAWMNNKTVQIGMEEAAYDVCVSYDSDSLNAMAALIAHAMTHYYEKHVWGNDFVIAFADLKVSKRQKMSSKSAAMKATNELAANYLGGFLAYSAGYQIFGLMPEFLVDIYADYDLPNELSGFPDLEDRIRLAVESEMKLEALRHISDAANYLIVLQQYDVVNDYYNYILKEFQSREIYNTAGVNALMAALQLFEAETVKYIYPIQLDCETSVQLPKAKTSFMESESVEQRKQLLIQAKYHFEQARSLDDNDVIAYVNLACVHDLLGNYEDADFLAKKAINLSKSISTKRVEGNAYIVRGIVNIHKGENENGIDFFIRAASHDKSCVQLAKQNIAIYNGIASDIMITNPQISSSKEKIGRTNLDVYIQSIDVDVLLELNSLVSCGLKKMNDSKILLNLIDGGQTSYTLIHLTKENYKGKTAEGIKIGSFKENLIQKYGEPTYIQVTRQGRYYVYDSKNIAFYIHDEKVEHWIVYRFQ